MVVQVVAVRQECGAESGVAAKHRHRASWRPARIEPSQRKAENSRNKKKEHGKTWKYNKTTQNYRKLKEIQTFERH